MRFRVTLRNDSTESIRIVGIDELEGDSNYLYYEVIDPSGDRYRCVGRVVYRHVMFDPLGSRWRATAGGGGARGCPTFLYPTRVQCDSEANRSPAAEGTIGLFNEPGPYRLKVVYAVSAEYELLWHTGQEGCRSNEFTLVLRDADTVERESFAARAPGTDLGALLGELNAHAKFDENTLRSVIRRYPDHPMIDYCRFALARSLTRIDINGVGSGAEEGIEILKDLRARVPDFRAEEIAKQLATAYYFINERDLAVSTFEETISLYPYMRQECSFMRRYIHALTGDGEAPSRWLESREKGKRGLEFLQQ